MNIEWKNKTREEIIADINRMQAAVMTQTKLEIADHQRMEWASAHRITWDGKRLWIERDGTPYSDVYHAPTLREAIDKARSK